jgi:hypothetical protein
MALTDNISVYYKLDETSGTQANDSVGTNHGTSGASIVVNQTGKINKCYLFDGTNASRITLPTIAGLQVGTSSVTFTAWVYPTNISLATSALIGGADGSFAVKLNTDGTLQVTKVNTSDFTASAVTLTQNAWNFVAVVYDQTADTITYYVNSNSTTRTSQTTTFTAAATSNLIGQRTSNIDKIIGNMDEIGFWLRALSGSEISTIYAGGSGLTYPFDPYKGMDAKHFKFSTF